jgi:hypothetical protein
VILLADFNAPDYDWSNGTPQRNAYYYNTIKGNLIQDTICFLGLNQQNNSVSDSSLLGLLFFNTSIKDLNVSISSCFMVSVDSYHLPLGLNSILTSDCPHIFVTTHLNYAKSAYFLLYITTCIRLVRWSLKIVALNGSYITDIY